jgi:hypothetical protein
MRSCSGRINSLASVVTIVHDFEGLPPQSQCVGFIARLRQTSMLGHSLRYKAAPS